MDKSFTITNHSIGSTTRNKTIDCYISPRWTLGNTLLDRGIPWNKSKLTHSFEYHNLSVFYLIADYISSEFNQTIFENLTSLFNMTENDTDSYLMTAFEQRYNFSFDDVEAHPENVTRLPWYNETLCGNQSFVLIREDRTFNPDWPETPLRFTILNIDHGLKNIRDRIDHLWPHCEGVILYDEDNLSHDCLRNDRFRLPVIFINGTDGHQIISNIHNYTVNLSFRQQWNTTVESYNLVGQINGSDPDRHHILVVNSLYDSVWSSGTADSAIGCGIVLALGRYYTEHHLKPKYTTQFVLFAGEEAGVKGAKSYKAKHEDYKIEKFIDLNQLCFNQSLPKTRLYVGTNKLLLKPYIEQIADEQGYETHMYNTKLEVIYRFLGLISDDEVYSGLTDRNDTITFLKGMTWVRHHRDGKNHTEGDSMRYYNDTDVAATSTVVFNISRYFCLNPDCRFLSVNQPWLKDSNDENIIPDSIQVNYTLNTTMPQDRVWVKATLVSEDQPILCRYKGENHYLATPEVISGNISINLPLRAPQGYYDLYLYLYNSTGEVNYTVIHLFDYLDFGKYANDMSSSGPFYMSPPNDPPNTPPQPQGDLEVHTNKVHTYTTSTTDPNNDHVWYQWKWETKIPGQTQLLTYYTMWVTGGPHQSGAPCHHIISWSEEGTYHVWVRAKDNIFNPNVVSDWSPYQTVHVTKGDGGSSWNTQFLESFSLDTVAVNQPTFCAGFNQNVDSGEQSRSTVNWTWDFGDGNVSYGENATHSYNQVGNYTIRLCIHDDYNNYLNCSQNITVRILNAGFHANGDWQPGKQARFTDTSAGLHPIVNWTWDFGDGNNSYIRNATHNYTAIGCYNVTLTVRDNQNNTHQTEQPIIVELTPPELAQVVGHPNPAIGGASVTIAVDLLDNQSGVKEVKVNITTPNNSTMNATMIMTNLTEYDYTYTFNDTWQPGVYNYSIWVEDNANNTNETTGFNFTIDTEPPSITTMSASPNTVGFGNNITINTNVTDDRSGVNNVSINITYPSGATHNPLITNMSHISGNLYRYVFSDTWHAGRYNYTIIAYDKVGNRKNSTVHSFNVSVSASMSIATLKDSYTGNQYINITDPPNPSQNLTVVGRGLTWNTYYNASSGTNILESYQEPVNYMEDNGSWTPINTSLSQLTSDHPAYNYGYKVGNNYGLFGVYFKPNIQNDWPVAFTYNRSTDPTTYVVRSKLVGVGYVDPQSNWAYRYLQTVQNSQGQTQNNAITYPGVFTGTNVTWSYDNTELKEAITMTNATKTVLQNHPPSSYGLHDASSYLVFITKLDYQILNLYNKSGLLSGNVTVSDTGVDLRDAFGQFKCGLPLGDAYEVNNESVRQRLTYRIVHLHGDTYLLSGVKVSEIIAMTFPVVIDPTLSVYSTSSDGYIYNSGNIYPVVHNAANGTVDSTAAYITIGQKKVSTIPPSYTVYRGFVFFNTSALPMNAYLDSVILSLYKKDDYSATDFNITIQTGEPTNQQSGQPTYPHNPLQAGDYNQSHYQGNGGSLNTTNFVNGHNNITLTQLSWINKTGTTKLCLRSSRDINGKTSTINEYVNVYSADAQGGPAGCKPKLIITYRNQSKIKNTGSTTIKGYLLIQVQFYNSSQGKWVSDNDTINETSPRTITYGNQLGLDTIFNGKIRASDLKHGTGTYRVYTTFRDPNGNILKTSSGVELKAWWQFSKT
ncbi:MAG TPA: PKD domain-containing protein [Candidatus Thermoplasmatota archaeon]|nr:PKD domain-containing protein [Candidatus Thermoplasmatota archaeon]